MNEFPWFWWIFRGVFSKNADGWKRFLMVFWSVSKKWIYIIDQETKSGFLGSGSELFLADQQGEDSLNDSFVIVGWWIMLWKKQFQTCHLKSLKSVKISEIRVFPIHCHSALSKTKSKKRVVILREAKLSRRIYRRTIEMSFCAKRSKVAESTGEPSNCHSAWSETESQNRIVILREAMRSRRIYRRINDGFCNSGRKRPPCRMTRWIAENEFKDPKLFRFINFPGYSYFPTNSLYWQLVILREAKLSRRI